MQRLLKLKIWITIVLLSCSINLLANDSNNLPTGELEQKDSVLIAYDDLRIANSKMIQLEYEKEINSKLRTIITNDSITIAKYSDINKNLNKKYNKTIKQRNVWFSIGIITTILSVILLVK